jgi:hypothetical protein
MATGHLTNLVEAEAEFVMPLVCQWHVEAPDPGSSGRAPPPSSQESMASFCRSVDGKIAS